VDQGRGEHLWGAQATAPAASWRRMCWRRLVQTSAVRGPVVCAPGLHAHRGYTHSRCCVQATVKGS